MKIVHLNTWSVNGGAAVAAFRHNEAMQRAGIDSKLVYLEKKKETDNDYIYTKPPLMLRVKMYLMSRFLRKIQALDSMFSHNLHDVDYSFNSDIANADIIYLHWVCGQFLSPKGIENLLKKGRIVVLYMHDMYPFTGGCHYSYECKRYMTTCTDCPQLKYFRFLANKHFRKKIESFDGYENLIVSAPSQWLLNLSMQSKILGGKKHVLCRNVVDESIFYPKEQKELLRSRGLNTEKKYILFSVYNAQSKYKGVKYLLEALSKLESENVELLIMGGVSDVSILSGLKIPYHLLGWLNSLQEISIAYSLANVLVVPSILENFPNVIVESFACGVPVVAFNIGGIPEQVIHKKTGWLAAEKDADDLLEGIIWVLDNADKVNMRQYCLDYFNNECSYSMIAKNHQGIFELLK